MDKKLGEGGGGGGGGGGGRVVNLSDQVWFYLIRHCAGWT